MNFIVILLTALVPMFTGFIYYHPKVLGNAWMRACNLTEDQIKSANMGVFMGVSILLSAMLAL